jgi:acyl-CoA thioester hydrolase
LALHERSENWSHVERIAIRWGDMDAMGHVNNTVYFRFMEQARISWFERCCRAAKPGRRPASSSPTPRATSRRPINYPGDGRGEDVRGRAGRLEPAHDL